jgi:SepF-like predicted cell division protein (DUF552 family)
MHTMGFVKRIFGEEPAPKRNPNDYIDLTEYAVPENGAGAANSYVRVAEIHRIEDIREFSTYVFDGNILILDFKPVMGDEILLRRVTNELRKLAQDVGGDIAGLGEHSIILTPAGVKIDRRKLKVAA